MYIFIKKLMNTQIALKDWPKNKICIPHLLRDAKQEMNENVILSQKTHWMIFFLRRKSIWKSNGKS